MMTSSNAPARPAPLKHFELFCDRSVSRTEIQPDGGRVHVRDHFEHVGRADARTWTERMSPTQEASADEGASESRVFKYTGKIFSAVVSEMHAICRSHFKEELQPIDSQLRCDFVGLTCIHNDLRALYALDGEHTDVPTLSLFDTLPADKRVDIIAQLQLATLCDVRDASIAYYGLDRDTYTLPDPKAFVADPTAALKLMSAQSFTMGSVFAEKEMPQAQASAGRYIVGLPSYTMASRYISDIPLEMSVETLASPQACFADYAVHIKFLEFDPSDANNPSFIYCVPLLGRSYDMSAQHTGITVDHLAGTSTIFEARGPAGYRPLQDGLFQRLSPTEMCESVANKRLSLAGVSAQPSGQPLVREHVL